MLTADQRARFEDQGFLVLPAFYRPEACAALKRRMDELVAGADGTEAPSLFSTTDDSLAEDEYFLSSGDQIRFFFEPDAYDERGVRVAPVAQALNKVGHNLHDGDPVFSAFSRDPALAELARDLGFVDPRLLQSMYIFKPPRIGGEVAWHCDQSFLWTEPPSVRGFWVALDPATRDNGCLWVLPGGHRIPPKTRLRRQGRGTTTEVLDARPYDTASARPIEAEVGTLVVLHGALPHSSRPNTGPRPRHAYSLHVIEGSAHYLADNWLQRGSAHPLRGF